MFKFKNMTSERLFFDNINGFDRGQYNLDFNNLNYIGNSSKNTVLHLMAMAQFKFDLYKPRILEILTNKLIDVNYINSRKRTCIIEAIKFKNWEFVKLVIENSDIDLSVVDDKELNAFQFSCYYDNPEIASLILDHINNIEYSDITVTSNISDLNERNKLIVKIYKKFYSSKSLYSTDDPEFKIYSENDFTISSDKVKGVGSYGVVNIAIEKSTGKEVVVKRFNNNINDKHFSDDIIKDVCFLKTLNRYGTSTKIYGIMYDSNGYIYMVMESLDKNLSEKIKLTSMLPKDIRETAFFDLLKEILICIDVNSKVGIIHCDTKDNNMMTDKNKNTRYIDYGFSYFLGISPYFYIANRPIHSGSYLSNDGYYHPVNKPVEYYDEDNLSIKFFSIEKGFTGLNIDIPSAAFMILTQTIGKHDNLYGVHEDTIYTNIKNVGVPYFCSANPRFSDKIKGQMIEMFGQSLTLTLMDMMKINPTERPTAREILNSKFFNNKLVIPEAIDLSSISLVNNNSISTNTIYNMTSRYNTISTQQYLRGGFVYYDDIYDHWKDVKVKLIRGKSEVRNLFTKVFSLANKRNISLDAFFSSVYYMCDRYSETNSLPPNSYERMCYIMMSYSKLYEDSGFDEDALINVMMASNMTKDEAIALCTEMFNNIKYDPTFFQMRPTMLFVGYIKFILMATCKESYINDIIGRFIVDLYKFITGSVGENITMKISDIVKKVYNELPGSIPINIGEQSDYKIKDNHVYYSKDNKKEIISSPPLLKLPPAKYSLNNNERIV